ncbi:MAG: DUF72 domain-containing protein [Alphaproteobacteria bacterium]|nr:DUF72 domain-containing protein [Alphaproteobacteria bacterium]MCW5740124.1 DUF72 domain-containing protein [Alphaproteobacteria bacterium]
MTIQPSLLGDTLTPRRRGGGLPAPAEGSPLRRAAPPGVYLGTSSWSFPGWQGLVWQGQHTAPSLSRDGLPAYGALGLLRTVGIDRSFYAPMTADEFAAYALQVPADFRFLVKGPALVTDAVMRTGDGSGRAPNRWFLDADIALDKFIGPAIEGLGRRAGPLVFQFSPVPRGMLGDPLAWVERLGLFLEMLPREIGGLKPLYAVELRNPEFLTPRLMRMLSGQGVRYVVGLHDRMPGVERQANALRVLDDCIEGDYAPSGPLIVRWNLRPGLKYEEAKAHYFPFNRLIDEDPDTRRRLATLVRAAMRGGHPAFVIANNKAEGSAPLTLLKLAEAIEAAG